MCCIGCAHILLVSGSFLGQFVAFENETFRFVIVQMVNGKGFLWGFLSLTRHGLWYGL